MTASGLAIKTFIATVEVLFPRPKFAAATEDEREAMSDAWMAAYTRVLVPYDDDELSDAAQRILAHRHPKKDGSFFPKPSECVEFCEKARDAKRCRETPLLSTGKRDPSPWAGWRTQLADDLIRGQTGQQASRDGWGLAFYNFCRENGRAPTSAHEIASCKTSRRALDQAMMMLHENERAFARDQLLEIGRKMIAKNNELRAKARTVSA